MTTHAERRAEPFKSTIHPEHPERVRVESVCLEILKELGERWFITVSTDPGSRRWNVSIGRRRSAVTRALLKGRSCRPEEQTAAFVEKWLRAATEELARESRFQFGMVPVGPVADKTMSELIDLVALYGGQIHPDGWITLPDDKQWAELLERSASLGVDLAASVR